MLFHINRHFSHFFKILFYSKTNLVVYYSCKALTFIDALTCLRRKPILTDILKWHIQLLLLIIQYTDAVPNPITAKGLYDRFHHARPYLITSQYSKNDSLLFMLIKFLIIVQLNDWLLYFFILYYYAYPAYGVQKVIWVIGDMHWVYVTHMSRSVDART